MGSCVDCGCETKRTATVYVGVPKIGVDGLLEMTYIPQTDFLCPDCVEKHARHNPMQLVLCLFLQLGWVEIARHGLYSVGGLLGAGLGLYGLWRLTILLYIRCRTWHKWSNRTPKWLAKEVDAEWEASDLYRKLLMDQGRDADGCILDIRAYQRIHGDL